MVAGSEKHCQEADHAKQSLKIRIESIQNRL
jgi:hypothetical protein